MKKRDEKKKNNRNPPKWLDKITTELEDPVEEEEVEVGYKTPSYNVTEKDLNFEK